MLILPFPTPEDRSERILGIARCLDMLGSEARDLDLGLVAHLIAVAREATYDAVKLEPEP